MVEPTIPPSEFPPDIDVPRDYRAALEGLRNEPMLRAKKWQEQQWRAQRVGAHPDILEFERRMIKRFKALNVPLYAHCIIRSKEQQLREYAEGDSKVKFGAHNVGCAIDLVHSTLGWGLSDKQWALVGHVGKEIIKSAGLALVSMRWGGPDGPEDTFHWDPAHWEIRDWKMVKEHYPWTPSK